MTEYDWLLIFSGAGLAVFLASQRLVRSLFALALIWLSAFTSAQLYKEAAFRAQAITGDNLILVEGVMFDFFLILFFVAGYILLKVAFPVTKLPNIGALDVIVGFMVGLIVAAIFVALISNSLGVMVSDQWPNNTNGWVSLQWRVSRSGLRPFSQRIVNIVGITFSPFFRGLPPVLVPQ
jgi:uncharacterized membrane protein required for colicin V production